MIMRRIVIDRGRPWFVSLCILSGHERRALQQFIEYLVGTVRLSRSEC
jgi:hypothetical protein